MWNRVRFRNAAAAGAALVAVLGLGAVPGGGASAATAPDCGAPMVKPTGAPWQCTFSDDFAGTALDRDKWSMVTTAETNFRNGPECFVDSPNNVSVDSGVLRVTARKEPAPFTCGPASRTFTTSWTGANVSTIGKFSQAFGRFEIRAAFPDIKVAGVQSALWLWPQTVDPLVAQNGEIDIAEFYSRHADRVIPFVHYFGDFLDPYKTNNYCLVANTADFHTYVLEWTPQRLKISFDGKVCVDDSWRPLLVAKPAPFGKPHFITLTQALGVGTNAFSATTTPLPATMKVDYVRVWS